MESLDAYTPEYPRESIRARFINYAPSLLVVSSMTLAPIPLTFVYCRLGVEYVGLWGYLPILIIASVLALSGVLFYRRASSGSLSLGPADRITTTCRIACVTFNLLMFTVFYTTLSITAALIFYPDKDETESFRRVKIGLCSATAAGTFFIIYSTYTRCRTVFYEKAIMLDNARKYGDPVLVCIPVFRLCGHFVLYTSTHKYELRLDHTSSFRPYFSFRPVRPSELDTATASPTYHYFVCGWTSRPHEEIVDIFTKTIRDFGEYNRFTNNCRTFLQEGCARLLDLTSVWHEDMLMVDPGTVLLVGQMAIMMYRSMLRDLCRWVWTVWRGPDWESYVRISGGFVDLADHEVDLRGLFDSEE